MWEIVAPTGWYTHGPRFCLHEKERRDPKKQQPPGNRQTFACGGIFPECIERHSSCHRKPPLEQLHESVAWHGYGPISGQVVRDNKFLCLK